MPGGGAPGGGRGGARGGTGVPEVGGIPVGMSISGRGSADFLSADVFCSSPLVSSGIRDGSFSASEEPSSIGWLVCLAGGGAIFMTEGGGWEGGGMGGGGRCSNGGGGISKKTTTRDALYCKNFFTILKVNKNNST